jgi:hypothetical protein
MFVLCCKDGNMERKVTWRTKGFKKYKNGSKGGKPRTGKKKIPPGALMFVLCCKDGNMERKVTWRTKGFNSTKMDQRGKTPDRKKNTGWGGGEIFRTCSDRPWGPPSVLYNGYRFYFPWLKRLGFSVDHSTHLPPRLKSRAIPLLPLWAFMAYSGVKFTFYLRPGFQIFHSDFPKFK